MDRSPQPTNGNVFARSSEVIFVENLKRGFLDAKTPEREVRMLSSTRRELELPYAVQDCWLPG